MEFDVGYYMQMQILGKNQPLKKTESSTSPLKHLQNLYSQKQQSTGLKMMLIIADELDYLITKDRAVLHDLFMLTTFPFARCILIGIANAIDLADRFLPRLQPLNCKSAIEMLQAELRESACNLDFSLAENGYSNQQTTPACDLIKQGIDIVRVDHMAIALSKTYRSPIMDTVQSLPQHQQIMLCSAVKLFRGGKKDTTIGEIEHMKLISQYNTIPVKWQGLYENYFFPVQLAPSVGITDRTKPLD
ncbi:hypothetical protein HYC85_007143 [Camellia sinensis]|uniref:Cdc6 C-terminal domain-containing protein n=1 Tax=Camellia sinensis TaxID=4442 RepID=A0A7J7HPE3_CAMSI|nr:hypothetical protein HYC85_007143 [Camellia sinensis]